MMRRRTAPLTDDRTLAGRRATMSPAAGRDTVVLRTRDCGTMTSQPELAHDIGLVDSDLLSRSVHRLPLELVPDAELSARAGEDDVFDQPGIVAQRRRYEQAALFVDHTLLGTGQVEVVVELHRRRREVIAVRDARLELEPFRVGAPFQAADIPDPEIGHEQTIVAELLGNLPELHRKDDPTFVVDSCLKCAAEHNLTPTTHPPPPQPA